MTGKKDKQQGLEETIREKVVPLLEETMERHWGITIPKLGSDISDRLKSTRTDLYIPLDLPFTAAKRKFKAEFIKKELRLHRGNVSQLARLLNLNRRSIHRTIKELALDIEEIRHRHEGVQAEYQQTFIDQMIRSALDQYRDIIQARKMEKLYEEVSTLSRNIVEFLPHHETTWKEAEREFEKQFLRHALEERDWNITGVARKIKIRPETLHRKIKRLQLRE